MSAKALPGSGPTDPPRPAARSALDVAIWFLLRASEERLRLPMNKLQLLLYIAQSVYAAKNSGQQLMPAVFLRNDDGPYEPNVQLALECGLAAPPQPTIESSAEPLLSALWKQYGALPTTALARVVAKTSNEPSAAVPKPAAASDEPGPSPQRGHKAKSEKTRPEADLRFTGDGRLVTRWAPRRRIERN